MGSGTYVVGTGDVVWLHRLETTRRPSCRAPGSCPGSLTDNRRTFVIWRQLREDILPVQPPNRETGTLQGNKIGWPSQKEKSQKTEGMTRMNSSSTQSLVRNRQKWKELTQLPSYQWCHLNLRFASEARAIRNGLWVHGAFCHSVV